MVHKALTLALVAKLADAGLARIVEHRSPQYVRSLCSRDSP
jgi:hypothetical protein